jgi:hypothetical protein
VNFDLENAGLFYVGASIETNDLRGRGRGNVRLVSGTWLLLERKLSGINSKLDIYLDSDYTVAVMSNYDPPAAERISQEIRNLICR